MLQTHRNLISSSFPFNLSHHPRKPNFLLHNYKPTAVSHPTLPRTTRIEPSWVGRAEEPATTSATAVVKEEEGPVELSQSIFATTDDPTPLQVSTSVLLTGAISVFLFRSLRRRAKRAKELKFRSAGEKKSLKEEALDNLKAMGSASIDAKAPPSPAQALLGGIAAGVIALILYKFTTTIEASLNRQTVSDNFSVRQITITIRTIINGLCYLATFVFGINSIGLVLYSGQLLFNSISGDSISDGENKSDGQSGSSDSTVESPTDSIESSSSKKDQSSDNKQ